MKKRFFFTICFSNMFPLGGVSSSERTEICMNRCLFYLLWTTYSLHFLVYSLPLGYSWCVTALTSYPLMRPHFSNNASWLVWWLDSTYTTFSPMANNNFTSSLTHSCNIYSVTGGSLSDNGGGRSSLITCGIILDDNCATASVNKL